VADAARTKTPDEDEKRTGCSSTKVRTDAGVTAKVDTGDRSKKQRKESTRPSASEDKSYARASFGRGDIGNAIKDCTKVDAAQKKTILGAKYKVWCQDKNGRYAMKSLRGCSNPTAQ
jgi:hypothetical protein